MTQIKKIPHEHTCQSTGKVEKNKMATDHWVKDRILELELEDTIESVASPALSQVYQSTKTMKISKVVLIIGELS